MNQHLIKQVQAGTHCIDNTGYEETGKVKPVIELCFPYDISPYGDGSFYWARKTNLRVWDCDNTAPTGLIPIPLDDFFKEEKQEDNVIGKLGYDSSTGGFIVFPSKTTTAEDMELKLKNFIATHKPSVRTDGQFVIPKVDRASATERGTEPLELIIDSIKRIIDLAPAHIFPYNLGDQGEIASYITTLKQLTENIVFDSSPATPEQPTLQQKLDEEWCKGFEAATIKYKKLGLLDTKNVRPAICHHEHTRSNGFKAPICEDCGEEL